MRPTKIADVLALIAVTLVASPTSPISQSRIEVYQLAPESPLASDGMSIFGVATDQRTLLVSSGAGADWRVLTRRSSRISGLAWDRGVLYFAEAQTRAVFRLPLDRAPLGPAPIPNDRIERLQHEPVRQPRDLAFSFGLFVSDPGSDTVFRIDPATQKIEPFHRVPLADGLEVAADQRTVTIAAGRIGEVHQTLSPPFPGDPADFAIWRTRERREPPPGTAATVVQHRFQPIQSPSAPAMANGSLYVIDESNGQVYVAFRLQNRAIPIAPFVPVKRATRLLPVGDSLMVLDAASGVLARWPLPIPTELQLGADPDLALDALYAYLHATRVLPVRTVPWRASLEDTLRAEGVIQKTAGPGLKSALCVMNPGVCAATSSGPAWKASPPSIVVPNLPIESQLDFETVIADELGDATFGELVEASISSPEFREATSDNQLWDLNASRLKSLDTFQSRQPNRESWGPFSPERLRHLRRRNFPAGFALTMPVERMRAFVALPRAALDDERLAVIRYTSPGFYLNPLEDSDAKAQSSESSAQDPPEPLVPCDLIAVGNTLKTLHKTIHFRAPATLPNPVFVGIVDGSEFDVRHPAFGANAEALTLLAPRPAAAATTQGPLMCGTKASFSRVKDHATAVASLIAGRIKGLEGLAGHVRIVPMIGKDDVVGTQLTSAFRDRRVRIFNISLHYEEKLVTNLRLKINNMLEALFVVSAGNDVTDSKPVCESATPYPAYPVCEGHRKNVLVVAATDLDGDGLIQSSKDPPAPGSNWNDQLIHIAAPGDGYYAAGRDNTYKPVRGTSFAAPLVTATAAMLYAKGVTQPWLIKQRIIATADPNDNLINKVYGNGMLNVERALHEPTHGVLWTTNTSKVVDLEPGDITITWQLPTGGSRTFPVSHVRRLTRSLTGNSYRIVYYDEVTDRLIVQNDVDPAQWKVRYRLIDPKPADPDEIIEDALGNYRDFVGPIIF